MADQVVRTITLPAERWAEIESLVECAREAGVETSMGDAVGLLLDAGLRAMLGGALGATPPGP